MSLDISLMRVQLTEVYSCNITHNLTDMADEARLYEPLWRPESLGIETAADLAPYLKDGLARLESDPERFRAMNPKNGWGSYLILVDFVRKLLTECQAYPDAKVKASP